MRSSTELISFITRHEGPGLKAYRDGGGVLTIGYGHTGPDVVPGQRITSAQADALLAKDIVRFEQNINRMVRVPLSQFQFDALVSFSYNCGNEALNCSTLLRKLNAGDYAGAAAEFVHWNHDNGRVVAGLTNRRNDESRLFLKGVYL